MKAKDWKFTKQLPDAEDVEAACKSSDAYFNLPWIKGLSDHERELDAFHAGFTRGIAWCMAKNDEE